MTLVTQIGGKYSSANYSLFKTKAKLLEMGIAVRHPHLDHLQIKGELTIAFDDSAYSFRDIERDYFRCIRNSSFHTVANNLEGAPGYIGVNAAVEIAYAMVQRRPCWMVAPPSLSDNVPADVGKAVLRNADRFLVLSEESAPGELLSELKTWSGRDPDYDMTLDEEIATFALIRDSLSSLD